jgi:hypothetical protein
LETPLLVDEAIIVEEAITAARELVVADLLEAVAGLVATSPQEDLVEMGASLQVEAVAAQLTTVSQEGMVVAGVLAVEAVEAAVVGMAAVRTAFPAVVERGAEQVLGQGAAVLALGQHCSWSPARRQW